MMVPKAGNVGGIPVPDMTYVGRTAVPAVAPLGQTRLRYAQGVSSPWLVPFLLGAAAMLALAVADKNYKWSDKIMVKIKE